MSEQQEPLTTYSCIIPHAAEPRVLLFQGEEGWSLPYIEHRRSWFPNDVKAIDRAMQDRLGIVVTVLRHIRAAYARPL